MELFNRLVRPLCLCKAGKIADHSGEFVKGRVLDVGAGRCLIAKELADRYGADITCIDISDLNETDLPMIVYDGKKIPFGNNKFDTVLIVYVLHHCEDPVKVLKECVRVCRGGGRIIIFEDTGLNLPTYVFDWIGNKLHHVEAP
ncbi:class I SAM-dependent methyltransferase, partial [Candidatus Woesearchaeota archaeon]|nr:class I SAM-dependent methyltransferase [Candidatus Woesearchaeota archaeon]